MIAKELRGTGWRFALGCVLFVLLVSTNTESYEEHVKYNSGPYEAYSEERGQYLIQVSQEEVVRSGIESLGNTFAVGSVIVGGAAILLGLGLISDEISSGTVIQSLSRPINRNRILMVKYIVGAVALSGICVVGGSALMAIAALRGYPMESVSITGVVLSVLLLWIGTLFVLGITFVVSTIFEGLIRSAMVTLLALGVIFYVPENIYSWAVYQRKGISAVYVLWDKLGVYHYWTDVSLFNGGAVPVLSFALCVFLAVCTLFAALVVFNRKAF